jgi:hypothetical protein
VTLDDEDIDLEALYPLLAELSPEDWEDGSAYGVSNSPELLP